MADASKVLEVLVVVGLAGIAWITKLRLKMNLRAMERYDAKNRQFLDRIVAEAREEWKKEGREEEEIDRMYSELRKTIDENLRIDAEVLMKMRSHFLKRELPKFKT